MQQGAFVLKYRVWSALLSVVRRLWLSMLGMRIGKGTLIPNLQMTWPHQVSLGENCRLEKSIYFKFDGIWSKGPSIRIASQVFIGTGCEFNISKSIEIGNNCLIASGCRFIDHDHGIKAGELIHNQQGPEKGIEIGNDVWLGCNVVVLKGVTIGDGAVVAAGAVVNKSILANEIWAGIPARKIGQRI